jgi:hypothetical protein
MCPHPAGYFRLMEQVRNGLLKPEQQLARKVLAIKVF